MYNDNCYILSLSETARYTLKDTHYSQIYNFQGAYTLKCIMHCNHITEIHYVLNP